MQPLSLALFLVMLELTAGAFVSLVALDIRGDTSRGYVTFQGILYLVFAILALLAMNAFATPQLVRGFGLDTPWLRVQGPLTLAFAVLMVPWNVLLWRDRPPRGATKKSQRAPVTALGRARFGLGIFVAAVGIGALFVDGMAYRALASSRLDGAFVVVAFIAGGLALGGVMTAMLLGHWYLNTPTASGRPLEFATTLMLAALAVELVCALLIGPSTAHITLPTTTLVPGTTIVAEGNHLIVSTPTAATGTPATTQPLRQAPLTLSAMRWLELLMGYLAPLILGAVALYLTRGRSFQSATGMLYLCVAFIFIGEILARGLLVAPILP